MLLQWNWPGASRSVSAREQKWLELSGRGGLGKAGPYISPPVVLLIRDARRWYLTAVHIRTVRGHS